MSSVNKVFILGRLGNDPEIRRTPDGTPVANMSVATSTFSTKNGEKREYTEWHRCVCFNRAAEVVEQYIKKGSQVFLEGSLQTDKYTDKNGIEKYQTQIIVSRLTMVGSKKDEAQDYAKASGKSFDDDINF